VRSEATADVDFPRYFRAGGPRDDVCARLRQPAFEEVRMARIERIRNRELEDAVAEELEPLIRGAPLARPGRVREDGLRQLRRKRVDQLREVSRGYWCEVT
jgi:hypothetical protein